MAELKCVVCESVLDIAQQEDGDWCIKCSSFCGEIPWVTDSSLEMAMEVFLGYQRGWEDGHHKAMKNAIAYLEENWRGGIKFTGVEILATGRAIIAAGKDSEEKEKATL